ncbi:MAG: adenylate/guanylate cyclase domain-containing protein [Myxococcota bacterium]|nr:adenylate/guanylate cyclase domain-containing protein [Myxococcota bacterium]
MSNTAVRKSPGELDSALDATVARRANFREGLRAMHRVRLTGYVVFALVTVVSGPLLGIDSIEFTIQGLALCGLGIVSAGLVLRAIRRNPPRDWMAYVAVPVDTGIITAVGFLMGGVSYTAQLALFVVVVMHGLLLHMPALVGIVACASAAFLLLNSISPVSLPVDEVIIFLATLNLTALATMGVIRMGRRLTNAVLEAQRSEHEILETFGRHVSPQVAQRLMESGAGSDIELRDVSVLFLDIRGFTTRSESHAPEEVVGLLNDLFSFMVDEIDRHQGIVNKFLGDGFMAIFGAPFSAGQDATNALAAAVAICERLETRIADRVLPPLRIGIGIHAGHAIAGNIGSARRKEYTLIGDVVNVASRVESLNKTLDSTILVTEPVWSHLAEPRPEAVVHPDVELRGRSERMTLYRIR